MSNAYMKKEYEKPCVVKIECDMVLPISSSVSTEIEEKDDVILNARPIDSERRNIWDNNWPSEDDNVF